jgi:hypothetical protein
MESRNPDKDGKTSDNLDNPVSWEETFQDFQCLFEKKNKSSFECCGKQDYSVSLSETTWDEDSQSSIIAGFNWPVFKARVDGCNSTTQCG